MQRLREKKLELAEDNSRLRAGACTSFHRMRCRVDLALLGWALSDGRRAAGQDADRDAGSPAGSPAKSPALL